MPVPGSSIQPTLTVQEWEKVLSQHRRSGWPDRHPLQRRKHNRYPIPAMATLMTTTDDGSVKETLCIRCPVLDASVEGLAIRHQQRISPDMTVMIDLHLGNRRLTLKGKILHTSGYPGAFRTSILLNLAN